MMPAYFPFVRTAPPTYLQTFDGNPSKPVSWKPADWDITVHSRDRDTWAQLPVMHAQHGADCAAPPSTHPISSYEDAVFVCRDHLMTAINAGGYGLVYMTPNQMVDFSEYEAVIRFDVSTERTSMRDWIDIWITPYEENLQLPLQDWLPDLNGEPQNAIHVVMDNSKRSTTFGAKIFRDFQVQEMLDTDSRTGYESFLEPSAKRRDTFELRISRGHIKFGMPAYNFWWVDKDIPELEWSRGVVQFGHHTYTPAKDCDGCGPNTWHWDNISISPAVPFTIVRAEERFADLATSTQVHFAQPSPERAHLRFSGIGKHLEVSFDGGITWQAAQKQAQKEDDEGHFSSYWMPIPAGISQVKLRGEKWWGGDWRVQDVSLWALN